MTVWESNLRYRKQSNMRVLIITTLPNSVVDSIQLNQQVNLHIVDCAEEYNTIAERVKTCVAKQNPDIILTYRCPYILPKEVFTNARLGAYNIHPTLLPKYPGMNPWIKILENKEQVSGVTLHKINEQIDKGEIIFQTKFRIEPYDTIETARQKADKIAAKLATSLINYII